MRRDTPNTALRALAVTLAGACLLVAGCGNDGSGKIPESQANDLSRAVEEARDKFDKGKCDEAESALLTVNEQVDSLDADSSIRDGLEELVSNLDDLSSNCEQAEETTTEPTTDTLSTTSTTSTTSEPTTSTTSTTSSETTSTTDTTDQTQEPPVSPPPTTPGGGTGGAGPGQQRGKDKASAPGQLKKDAKASGGLASDEGKKPKKNKKPKPGKKKPKKEKKK